MGTKRDAGVMAAPLRRVVLQDRRRLPWRFHARLSAAHGLQYGI
ncbi:hypothetical protein [Stappia sediminis]|nr:hypothetical protein [Stappia sediminis]